MDSQEIRSVAKLVVTGLLVGGALTAAASLIGHHHGDPLSWLSTVGTVGALVVAIGIYAAQRRDQDIARQELLDRLDAQDELLNGLAQQEPAQPGDEGLTDAQRREVEKVFGPGSIDATWQTGDGGGRAPRLVRTRSGEVAMVFSTGRGDRTIVRPLTRGGRSEAGARRRHARRDQTGPTP